MSKNYHGVTSHEVQARHIGALLHRQMNWLPDRRLALWPQTIQKYQVDFELLHPILLKPCYPGLWLTIRIFPEQRPAAGRCPPISHQLSCCAVLLCAPVCSCVLLSAPVCSCVLLWCAMVFFAGAVVCNPCFSFAETHRVITQDC